jgi:hypothetical protein
LAEKIHEADQPGQSTLRQRLIEVLAEIAPESRKEWWEVDVYLTRKEEVETLERKLRSNTASVEDLVSGLKRSETSWRAALDLEELGPPKPPRLFPRFVKLLDAPDRQHAQYFANAIKAIDPASPKPRFERDDLIGALRALSDLAKEIGDTCVVGTTRAVDHVHRHHRTARPRATDGLGRSAGQNRPASASHLGP